MDWMVEHQRSWRLFELGLLILAIFGPWAFDRIVVPADYPCDTAIRLEGDYCGFPLSGMWMLWAVVSEFYLRVSGLFTGSTTPAEWYVSFQIILGALAVVFPVFTTLFLLRAGNRRRLQKINFISWGLAIGICLLFAVSSYPKFYWQLWGTWLYIVLAIGALLFEGLLFDARKKTFQ